MKIQRAFVILGLLFFLSTSVFADEYKGAFHNYNGPYEHNTYYSESYNKALYGGTIDVDAWDDGIWYDSNLNDDTNGVLGVPDEGYYDPSCQMIDDCSTGTCNLVYSCEKNYAE